MIKESKALVVFVILAIVFMAACKGPKESSVLKIYHGKNLLESVSSQDFLAVFTKNNLSDEPLSKESIDEYLELFINYKLKVKEAEALGMDTIPSFVSELAGYREQLAKPYLNDQTVTDRLIEEAWERMQFDVRVSHILVSVNRDATPQDTLSAWTRINDAHKQLMQGADFASVAAEYSDDPYAKDIPPSETSPGRLGNKGDLGYFTVFDMVYPFENAAYSTPVGQISQITKSVFGYHILKVTDKSPAMGRTFLAHVFVPHPRTGDPADSISTEKKINDIYAEYLKGEMSFDDLAKVYSEDKNNAQSGGVLRWFNTHGLVPQFVAVLKEMEIDDVSKPIKTMYGWHIIKLLNQERPDSYEKELPNIRQRISKDTRAQKSREEAITQIKNEFGFKEFPSNADMASNYMDSTLFFGTWKFAGSGMEKNKKPVLTIGDKTHTLADFGRWIEKRQSRAGAGDLEFFIRERFKEYSDDKVIAYKEQRLEQLYPEFKALMREYRDGILLFDLMDKKVWSRAIIDTVGLQEFYQEHKHNFRWDLRVNAAVFVAKTKPGAVTARSMVMAGFSSQEILDSLNKESALELTVRQDKFQAGDNLLVDALPWNIGISDVRPLPEDSPAKPGFFFINFMEIVPPEVKQLAEVRGIMISLYQEELERRWLEELRQKYRVEIMSDELEKLYQ